MIHEECNQHPAILEETVMKFTRPMVITALLLTAMPAFAQSTVTAQLPKDGGPACQGRGGLDSSLKLSPDQKQKLGALHDQFILSNADKKAQLQVAHDQMHRLFEASAIDKQAVLSLETKINGLRDDLAVSRVNLMLASADIFTPEQRAAFEKMRGMHGFRHHHFGHREGGPGERGSRDGGIG